MPLSKKCRYFCPSCHAKRVALWRAWRLWWPLRSRLLPCNEVPQSGGRNAVFAASEGVSIELAFPDPPTHGLRGAVQVIHDLFH